MVTMIETNEDLQTIFERRLYDLKGKSTGMKEIYDRESQEYLSTVSTRYMPVEHHHVKRLAEITLNKLGLEFDLKENYPNYGREAYLRYVIKGINDEVKPLLTIKNGYKSGNSLKLFTGTYTIICSNGAILDFKQGDQSFTHVKSTEFSDQKNGLFMNEIDGFIKGFAGHLEYLEQIKQIEMTYEMIERYLKDFSEKEAREIFNLFKGRGTAIRLDNSVHSFYQTCTEYYSHSLKGKNIDKKQIIKLAFVQKSFDKLLKVA